MELAINLEITIKGKADTFIFCSTNKKVDALVRCSINQKNAGCVEVPSETKLTTASGSEQRYITVQTDIFGISIT